MNTVSINCTTCISDLCILGAAAGTDKSPLIPHGKTVHRHAYTTPYSLLFESFRHKPIKFAEIGVLEGASLIAWSSYFSKAKIYGFDINNLAFPQIQSKGFPIENLSEMDASNAESIKTSLSKFTQDGELYDVILDDASHLIEHQVEVIRNAIHFLKRGGILIIEDIRRDISTDPYQKVFEEIKHLVSFHTFILCDHPNTHSPGWNNDKLLVIYRA
jgi:predicted O-methyltransferase YrrM